MALERIFPSLYRVDLGHVNSFVIDAGEEGLVLVDAGTPADAVRILEAVGELGRDPVDVRNILVTHCHVDHAGWQRSSVRPALRPTCTPPTRRW
jgi:glyoxylase-like metal-dependent hydrolase (beta-lactamase superfamily II)